MCPTVEGHNPTVLPIPESRDTQGHPGQVPCVPEWRATIPLSFPSQSPGTPGTSRTGPVCPRVEGYNPTVLLVPESRDPRDIPDRSRVSQSGGPQSHCPVAMEFTSFNPYYNQHIFNVSHYQALGSCWHHSFPDTICRCGPSYVAYPPQC